MALTETQKLDSARRLAKELWDGGRTGTANMDLTHLKDAVASIDVAMDTVISAIPAAWQAKTIKQALIDNLPEPFQSGSTPAQKALALAAWVMKEAGLI